MIRIQLQLCPLLHRTAYGFISSFILIAALSLSSCATAYSAAPGSVPSMPVVPTVTITAPTLIATALPRLPTATLPPTPSLSSPSLTPTPGPDQVFVPAGRVTVPILLYHHVSNLGDGRYVVRSADFRAQMAYLAQAGYQTISISQLAQTIRTGAYLPRKPIVLTFDDGYADTYQNAFPILEEFGFKGVAYIITRTLEPDQSYGYMQEDELKVLVKAGWEIGSHSISHSDLRKNPKLGLGTEIEQSRKDLESRLGVPVRSFSYPFGSANAWIEDRMADYGYDSAVGLDILVSHTPKRLYYLSRREVSRDLKLKEFRALLTPGSVEAAMLAAETPAP